MMKLDRIVCYRPKSAADQEVALATIKAALTFSSGVSYDPSTIEWEALMLEGSDLGTVSVASRSSD